LLVRLATRDGLERTYTTHFTWGVNGGVKLGDMDEADLTGGLRTLVGVRCLRGSAQAAVAARCRRRCTRKPSPAKPISIIAQVEGSGTVDISVSSIVRS